MLEAPAKAIEVNAVPSLSRYVRGEIVIAIIALLGLAVALYCTSLGIGTDVDASTYLMTAHSLFAGKGLTMPTADGGQIPMTGFPPLLPMVLAILGYFGIDPYAGSRWFNALLFGGNILLIGSLVKKLTKSSAAAIFSAFLATTTVDVLLNHSLLITEPLFLFFVLVGLILVVIYLERPSLSLVLLFSAAFALASATRYVGVCLIAVGAGAILFGAHGKRQWSHLAIYLAIFCVPLAIWGVRNFQLIHQLTNRTIAFHPPALNRFVFSYVSLSTWMLPSAVPKILRTISLAAILLFLVIPVLRRRSAGKPWSFQEIGLMFLCSYVVVFTIAQTYFDAQLWMAGRHLLIVYLVGLVVVVCNAKELLDHSRRNVRIALLAVCFVLAGISAVRFGQNVLRFHREGIGFSSLHWQSSPLLAKVRELDIHTPLITNSEATLYLRTGRLARPIPNRMDALTQRERPEYGREIAELGRLVQDRGGVIVFFTDFAPRGAVESLEKRLQLKRSMSTADGYLLTSAQSTTP